MARETVKIVIVGHVDHGKSTLIGRLLLDTNSLPKERIAEIKKISKELGKNMELAFLTDQLKEERERGITIDTTQIFFKTPRRNFVIIDAPGHVEFLKNMITGATQAEAAVLIIDAKEGIMEQTRRHLYIIQLIGIKQVIVVLNKMDLVEYDREIFNQIKQGLSVFLDQVNIKTAIVIPISAKENDNISRKSFSMSWFRGPTLLEALDSLKIEAQNIDKPLILPVQDVYQVDEQKIIVGMISSGRLKQGQKIKILPEFKETTINAIITFDKNNKEEARAGENIGITLKEPLAVKRGNVIIQKESSLQPTTYFKGNIFWLSQESLRINETVMLRCATQETPGVIEKIEKRLNTSTLEIIEEKSNELKANEAGQLLFKTEKPILLTKFAFIEELGRFVIELNHNLQGAGIVT